jgi:hypothetical protein
MFPLNQKKTFKQQSSSLTIQYNEQVGKKRKNKQTNTHTHTLKAYDCPILIKKLKKNGA